MAATPPPARKPSAAARQNIRVPGKHVDQAQAFTSGHEPMHPAAAASMGAPVAAKPPQITARGPHAAKPAPKVIPIGVNPKRPR